MRDYPTLATRDGDPKQNQDLADRMGATLETKMREVAMSEFSNALRPGGLFEARQRM